MLFYPQINELNSLIFNIFCCLFGNSNMNEYIVMANDSANIYLIMNRWKFLGTTRIHQ